VRFFKKSDLIVIFSLLAVAAAVFFAFQGSASGIPAKAEIYYGSELVKTVVLTDPKPERFTIPQDENVVFEVYGDGSICFSESDCPDKICVKTGRLSKVGETAACIPNKIFMKIVPLNPAPQGGGPDVISG